MNSGEVPNMFPTDERMAVMEMVRPAASKKGLETPLELWGFFVQQVRTLFVAAWMQNVQQVQFMLLAQRLNV